MYRLAKAVIRPPTIPQNKSPWLSKDSSLKQLKEKIISSSTLPRKCSSEHKRYYNSCLVDKDCPTVDQVYVLKETAVDQKTKVSPPVSPNSTFSSAGMLKVSP